jgi:alkyl hydroperoxide reductase subunit AhpF
MAILTDQVKRQLQDRFAEQLSGPVELTLYVRPGSGRLILPSGLGCATCEDARQLVEDVREAAPDQIGVRVVDVTGEETDVHEVPTLTLGSPGETPRIRWQGLPAGYEFATVVDAVERVSSGAHGLAETSMEALARLTDPVDVMVFATPT